MSMRNKVRCVTDLNIKTNLRCIPNYFVYIMILFTNSCTVSKNDIDVTLQKVTVVVYYEIICNGASDTYVTVILLPPSHQRTFQHNQTVVILLLLR